MRFIGQLAGPDGAEHEIRVEPIEGGYEVTVDGTKHVVDTATLESSVYSLIVDNRSYEVSVHATDRTEFAVQHGGFLRKVNLLDPLAAAAGVRVGHAGPAQVNVVMAGRVVQLLVNEGDQVEQGQGLIVVEAMKMENEVPAPRAGTVKKLLVSAGQALETGEQIALIE